MSRFFGSLSRRIYFAFLVVAVVPTAIAGALGVYYSLQTLRSETVNNLEQEVSIRAEGAARFLAQLASELRYLAASPTLTGLRQALGAQADDVAAWRDAIQREYANLAKFYPHIYQIRFLAEDGFEQVRVDRIGEAVRVVAEHELQNKGDRYYFTEAMDLAPGAIYVSPLDLNVEFGQIELPERPVIRMAMRLDSAAGAAEGLLIVNLHADMLLDQIQQMAGVREGHAVLFDRAGYYLSRQDGLHAPEAGFAMKPVASLESLLGERAVARLLAGEAIVEHNGWIMAARSIVQDGGGEEGLGRWMLAIAFPERALLSRVFNLYVLYVVLLSALLVTALGGYLVSRRLLGPLDLLSSETEAIAGGDFSRRVDIPGEDEIAALGARFNVMAERLQTLYAALASRRDELEHEVRARTAELEQERSFLARLFEQLTDGVMQIGPDGRISLSNPQASHLLGLTAESDHLIGERWPLWPALVAELGSEPALRADVNRSDRVASVSLSRHEDGYVVVARDVTLERRLENDRREIDRQMFQMDKMITLGELAMGLAHEVGNPLAGMKAVAQAMQYEEDLSVPVLEALRRMEREIDRLANFLKSFHGFAAPRPLNLQTCALAEVLDDVVFWTRKEAGSQGVTVELAVDPAFPLLHADQAALKQVLLNLLINALHASAPGGHVRIHAFAHATSVEIRVEDDGSGIDAEVLPQVFDTFFTTKAQGTGLGLAIVRKIVRQHGGDIVVSSEPGVGTCFAVTLPHHSRGQP